MRRIALILLTVTALGHGVAGCALRTPSGATVDDLVVAGGQGAAIGGAVGGPQGAAIGFLVAAGIAVFVRHKERGALLRKTAKPGA